MGFGCCHRTSLRPRTLEVLHWPLEWGGMVSRAVQGQLWQLHVPLLQPWCHWYLRRQGQLSKRGVGVQLFIELRLGSSSFLGGKPHEFIFVVIMQWGSFFRQGPSPSSVEWPWVSQHPRCQQPWRGNLWQRCSWGKPGLPSHLEASSWSTFRFAMIPWSRGWIFEVVFFGRNTPLIFLSLLTRISGPGCAGQLSSRRMVFSSCPRRHRCLLTEATKAFTNHSSKRVAVIHAFPGWRYVMGSFSMFI